MAGKIGVRINIPFLQGAYLALNAVPDAFFLGDGPSCIFDKAAHIHGRHDLFSTLLSCDSRHRVQHPGVHVFKIAGDCEGDIAASLRSMAAFPGCGVVFMGSMPMCSIVGTDYDRILREAMAGSKKPAFTMPRRSAVSGDWLDGYASVMEAMAAGMDLSGAKPKSRSVALVGYLMDRNEGDHLGNLKELERTLRALDLEPVSIWLSGRPYERLRDARRAGAVISMPHGRKAARILAKRLGARLIEAGLPFGLEATRRFVELLGREFSCEKQAQAFIAAELDHAAPLLAWSVPHVFLNRTFAFSGDPHYALGFAEQIEDLGGRIVGTIVIGGDYHLSEAQRQALERRPGTVFEPLPSEIRERWGELARREGGADLIVGSAFAFAQVRHGPKWLEFGYPSEDTHFLRDEPFLGFAGALGFLSRVANEVSRGMNQEADAA
ncbi:MAG: nitrogenase component 1 [Elusimicrobiota bacterium]